MVKKLSKTIRCIICGSRVKTACKCCKVTLCNNIARLPHEETCFHYLLSLFQPSDRVETSYPIWFEVNLCFGSQTVMCVIFSHLLLSLFVSFLYSFIPL